MTSQGKAKRSNRVAETGCQSDEKLAVLAELLGHKPDWSVMSDCWKRVLTMQFHDILPGSSINAVYTEDSAENYAAIDKARADFIASTGLESGKDMILAVNTLSWERNALCEYSAGHELPESAVVADSDGNIIPTVLLGDRKTLLFRAEFPALGAKAFKVSEGTPRVERNAEIHEVVDGLSVETTLCRAVIDRLGRLFPCMTSAPTDRCCATSETTSDSLLTDLSSRTRGTFTPSTRTVRCNAAGRQA